MHFINAPVIIVFATIFHFNCCLPTVLKNTECKPPALFYLRTVQKTISPVIFLTIIFSF